MFKAAFGLRKLVHVLQFRTVCKELQIICITLIGSAVKISWNDRGKNGEVLHKVMEERSVLHTIRRGHAVAQLFETLLYKPEGRGFDSRWCHWNFSLT